MAEDTTQAAEPTATPEPHGDGTDWKAEARKWQQRAKENRDEARALREQAEARADYDEVVAERDRLRAERARRELVERVAGAAGVPAGVVAMLSGEGEEELARQVEELKGGLRSYPNVADDGGAAQPAPEDVDGIRNREARVMARARNVRLQRQQ